MAAPSWSGAIKFGDFPITVALHQRITSRSGDSFKMMGSDKKPVKSILVESGEYAKLEKDPHAAVVTIGRNDTGRGVKVAKDEYVVLSKDAREAIASAERSTIVEPKKLVGVGSVPFDLKTESYAVVPDKKVPGMESSVDALWSYLKDEDLAYTTELTMRSGSRDRIIVLYAGDEGLLAVALPFGAEVNASPEGFARTYVKGAAERLGEWAEQFDYEVGAFDFDEYESSYTTIREAAVDAALKGKKPVAQPKVPELGGGKDLMSAIAEGVGTAPKAKKASRARGGKKKPAAKRMTSRKKKVGA